MKKWAVLMLMTVFIVVSGETVFAKSKKNKNEEKVQAVQNRLFNKHHEIALNVGYVPDDEFYYSFPVGIGYTYNFNEKLSWEVARFEWFFNGEKSLKEDLESDFDATPERYKEPQYMLLSNLYYRPLYGKDAFHNNRIINHETTIFLGGGAINYIWNNSVGESDSELAPCISVGVGKKYFINDKFSINPEIRDLIIFRDDEIENRIYFGVGFGFRFNLSARKSKEDDTLKKLNDYLND